MTDATKEQEHDWFNLPEATAWADEGWILPDGTFYAAFRMDAGPTHPDIAKWLLGEDGERKADILGWLRISDYGDRCAKPLTQAQLDTLFDYCEHCGSDYADTVLGIKIL
jgi:hypothetical protein